MTIVQQHIDHLEAMKNSVEDVLREVLVERKGEIVNLVKYGQLSKGLNSSGKPLQWAYGSGFYAESTQSFANRDKVRIPKLKGAPYNFSWSGETLDNMDLKLISKSYDIFTRAGKQRLLEELYGEIFELTKEHNDYVNKKILEPQLVKWLEENWWKTL
jgi:hypothetical protein